MSYAWENNGLDEVAAKELWLYITNDESLYRQQHAPIIKSLVAKKARGVYNGALATKMFGYLVESGAKKYYAENVEGKRSVGAFVSGVGSGWHEMFPVELRRAVAEELRDEFEVEYNLGNYGELVPKKYRQKVTYKVGKKPPSGKAGRDSAAILGGMR